MAVKSALYQCVFGLNNNCIWYYKPVAFVGYGEIGAGIRAIQMLKQVATTLSMMPVFKSVNIPFFSRFINEQGVFEGDKHLDRSAHALLQVLIPWTEALKGMREN